MITRGKDTMYYIHQDYCAQSCQYEHEYVTSINDWTNIMRMISFNPIFICTDERFVMKFKGREYN
jgi:hypothetical protein